MNLTPKQETIVEKSLHLFGQNGFTETSMNDIASAMDMKPASLYNHIESKKQILLWICQRVSHRLQELLIKLKNTDAHPFDQFELFIEKHIEHTTKYAYEFKIFSRYRNQLQRVHRVEFLEVHEAYVDHLTHLNKFVIARENNPDYFPQDYQAQILISILESIPYWSGHTQQTPKEIARQIAHSFLQGFTSPLSTPESIDKP
ncbi:TetR/AcrR family transcriptional regulator [Chryseobacterium sp. A321]